MGAHTAQATGPDGLGVDSSPGPPPARSATGTSLFALLGLRALISTMGAGLPLGGGAGGGGEGLQEAQSVPGTKQRLHARAVGGQAELGRWAHLTVPKASLADSPLPRVSSLSKASPLQQGGDWGAGDWRTFRGTLGGSDGRASLRSAFRKASSCSWAVLRPRPWPPSRVSSSQHGCELVAPGPI